MVLLNLENQWNCDSCCKYCDHEIALREIEKWVPGHIGGRQVLLLLHQPCSSGFYYVLCFFFWTTREAFIPVDIHLCNNMTFYFSSQACLPYLKVGKNPHILNISPPLSMKPHWFKGHVGEFYLRNKTHLSQVKEKCTLQPGKQSDMV